MAQWALDYDGIDNYASHPTFLDTVPTTLTFEAWIFVQGSGAGGNRTVVAKRPLSSNRIQLTVLSDDRVQMVTRVSGTFYVVTSAGTISLNTWHYVVGIYVAGQALKVYLDTVETTGDVSGTVPNGTLYDFCIGAIDTVPNEEFDGIIDEVRISDVVRSQAEIDAIWNNGNGVQFEVDGDTMALWHKNDGSGGTILDETANDIDCTITGASWVAGYNFLIAAQAVGGGAVAIAGSLGWVFKQVVGAGAIAISGTLVWKFKQSVGAGSIAITGILGRLIKIGVGAGSIAIAGSLSTIKTIFQTVGAGAIAMSGLLGRKIKIAVGGGAIAISGVLSLISEWISLTLKSRSRSLTLQSRSLSLTLPVRD